MICIPKPFAIAIDDLGWMIGHNHGYLGEGPYRTGLKRRMDLDDYLAVINLAKKVNIRFQGLFIVGELDREGVIDTHPSFLPQSATWHREVSELQISIMDLVKSSSAHLEFGLHGVSHEYWPEGHEKFKRAEWYNHVDQSPWPKESIIAHVEAFQKIMAQYDLEASKGHSFPESFVPCAYSYFWNPDYEEGDYSLGNVLHEYGIRYANTDFSKIPQLNPPIDAGMDHGVHVMNRHNYGNLWYEIGKLPTQPIKYQDTEFIEVHWPNVLAQDTFLQDDVTEKWAHYFAQVDGTDNRYCSKNTAEHHSQFLYRKYCKLQPIENGVTIDNSRMPLDDEHQEIAQTVTLKITRPEDMHYSNIRLNGQPIPAYFENKSHAYFYLPKLQSEIYELTYELSKALPSEIIWHDTTCNIHSILHRGNTSEIKGRFYGEQTIVFFTDRRIESVTSESSQLDILSWKQEERQVHINIKAADIQGISAVINLS